MQLYNNNNNNNKYIPLVDDGASACAKELLLRFAPFWNDAIRETRDKITARNHPQHSANETKSKKK